MSGRKKLLIGVGVGLVVLLALVFPLVLMFLASPPAFDLDLSGPDGLKVIGTVTVDGKTQRVSGPLPQRLSFHGRLIDFAIAPIDGQLNESITVKLFVDGDEWVSCSAAGVKGGAERSGLPFIGGAGAGAGGMTPEEIATLRGDRGDP